MPGDRVLWTGPYGAAARDHALAGASLDPSGLWLAASPLARDQIRRELAIRSPSAGTGRIPRVWCWADLWARVRGELGEGPSCLSEGAAGAVFGEAIRQARRAGELVALASVIDWPGYRSRLRRRFAEWTIEELSSRARPPAEPAAAAEWAAFLRYRNLLRKLGAEDEAGLAVWASRRLLQRPPASLAAFAQVTFLDWESPTPAHWRALDHALRHSRSVRVTMAWEDGEGSLYEATAPARARLLGLGFAETRVRPEIWRPAGLRELERSLFRRSGAGSGLGTALGLAIHGAPQGEGMARVVARGVRDLLERGTEAEDILVLFRKWGEPAEIALDVLREWGIPVHAEAARPLGAVPSVAALLLGIGLSVEDWATDRVIRLLRNGQVRPGWPGSDALSRAAAASVIKASSVFRGREPLLNWLDRQVAEKRDHTVKAERARLARDLVERLFTILAPLDQPRPFAEQVEQLFRAAAELGIGHAGADGGAIAPDGEAGLDRLRDVLEDQAGVLERLGRGEASWSWAAFVAEVESFATELTAPPDPPRPGAVRMATVDEVAGARAAHVILADLAEGTFPARDAVEAFLDVRPGVPPDAASREILSREMLRFLRVIGSAESGLVMVYPTTDAKGQDLLRAGFLDELMEVLTPEALAACHRSVRRLDPALVDSPELAGSPGDRRVRAVALARTRGERAGLIELVRRGSHRRILDGTAAALQVLARRLRGTPFGEYDGLLRDGDVVLDVADAFPSDYLFSASQLETYIACPFQFFSKYVLKLEPAERREEIDEDYTERGSKIHDILELLEQMRQQDRNAQSFEELAQIAVGTRLDDGLIDASEVDRGLAEIERRRLVLTIERYVVQHRNYESDPRGRPIPHRFEVSFGKEDADGAYPHLEIGRGARAVRLQGKIDRIDIVEGPEGRGFRVIDYKSGHGPSANDVRQARLLQLPLYAMAVERIILAGDGLTLHDVGYWALRKEGYRAIAFEEWHQVQAALESYVAELVDRLRRGVFVVDSQIDGCEGFCDYRAICRVRQARLAAKQNDRPAPPELSASAARRRTAGNGRRPASAGGAP
jgi:RecB family exonuclease